MPTAIITDGDFYFQEEKIENGEKKIISTFHKMEYNTPTGANKFYDGLERMRQLVKDIGMFSEDVDILDDEALEATLNKEGIFIGFYTLEIDIFENLDAIDKDNVCNLFNELTAGGDNHKSNFKDHLDNKRFDKCLKMIEGTTSKIGKGRFAQRLSLDISPEMVPDYIKNAINYIVENF